MECSDPARFMDDLLDFGSGNEEEEEEDQREPSRNNAAKRNKKARSGLPSSFTPTALGSALLTVLRPDDRSGPFAEEELEWISNKDAFPSVETFPGFLSSPHDNLFLPVKQRSPDSVLGTTLTNLANTSGGSSSSSSIVTNCCGGWSAPNRKKQRSKRRPRQQLPFSWRKDQGLFESWAQARRAHSRTPLGRKCQHCGVEKTPQWRAGPHGAKTLCNACGVRYKSGRLVPEYRPANSPTFCSELHSNSHRKVVEMRRQKEMA